jgi:hypothetical protein
MLPSTKIYFMQDVKNDKVKKPSLWWPIVEGVFAVVCLIALVLIVLFAQELMIFFG